MLWAGMLYLSEREGEAMQIEDIRLTPEEIRAAHS